MSTSAFDFSPLPHRASRKPWIAPRTLAHSTTAMALDATTADTQHTQTYLAKLAKLAQLAMQIKRTNEIRTISATAQQSISGAAHRLDNTYKLCALMLPHARDKVTGIAIDLGARSATA